MFPCRRLLVYGKKTIIMRANFPFQVSFFQQTCIHGPGTQKQVKAMRLHLISPLVYALSCMQGSRPLSQLDPSPPMCTDFLTNEGLWKCPNSDSVVLPQYKSEHIQHSREPKMLEWPLGSKTVLAIENLCSTNICNPSWNFPRTYQLFSSELFSCTQLSLNIWYI